MGFIYRWLNKVSGKEYIGKTVRSHVDRKREHLYSAKCCSEYLNGGNVERVKQYHHTALYKAMHKHGVENFVFEVLEEASDDKLDDLEIKYIAERNTRIPHGYNIMPGGSGDTVESREQKVRGARTHDEIRDLPAHCIYLEKDGLPGVAINKHPLCRRKNFMVKKHGSMDEAKKALREFLRDLEQKKTPVVHAIKRGDGLPRGVRQLKNGSYFVDKTVNGVTNRRAFSAKPTADENRQDAINYVNSLIALHN